MRDIFLIILGLFCLVSIFYKTTKKQLSEKFSFFWMIGALLVTISPLLIPLIDKVSSLIGIAYAPSLFFLIGIIFCLFLIFRLSQTVSKNNEQIRELAQYIAILENELKKNNTKLNNDQRSFSEKT